MFMGFIMHFYIIFGTKLLTQSPVPISVFPLFQCFAEKEYQTESKRNETFGKVNFWNGSNPGDLERTSGNQRGEHEAGGAPTPWGRPPPSWLPLPTSFAYIYPYTLKPSGTQ